MGAFESSMGFPMKPHVLPTLYPPSPGPGQHTPQTAGVSHGVFSLSEPPSPTSMQSSPVPQTANPTLSASMIQSTNSIANESTTRPFSAPPAASRQTASHGNLPTNAMLGAKAGSVVLVNPSRSGKRGVGPGHSHEEQAPVSTSRGHTTLSQSTGQSIHQPHDNGAAGGSCLYHSDVYGCGVGSVRQ